MNQLQQVPAPTRAHYDEMVRIEASMYQQLTGMWKRVDKNHVADSWSRIVSQELPTVEALQLRAAKAGADYSASTLAFLGDYEAPQAFVNPRAFVGYAPDGRSLTGLLDSPLVHTRAALGAGAGIDMAISAGSMYLQNLAITMVQDIGRQAASVDIAVRPGIGYVRMLNPPSCRDCTILAGKFYRWNTGFQRHPHCKCVHVPASQKRLDAGTAEGLLVDPYEYFHSLDEAMQNRVFGVANAQAIRDGSDIFQVVNARRGVQSGKMFTTEGMTRRGNASKGLKRGQKRLTPEGIYRLAEKNNLSRTETLKLLETHGYVLPGGQNPLGVLRGQREGFGQYGRGGARKTASQAVLDARATGVRDLQNPYTMTAAERRVWEAERDWLEIQSGYNPYTAAAIERRRGVRIVSSDAKLTDAVRARAENAYREAVITRGAAVSTISKEERLRRLEEWKANQLEILAGRRTIITGGRPTLQTNAGKAGTGAYYNGGKTPVTAAGGAGSKPPKPPKSASGSKDYQGPSGRKADGPPVVDGKVPGDWTKGRRVVLDYGGTDDLPGRFTNPARETLWPHEMPSVNRLLAHGKNVEWLPEKEIGVNPDLRMDGKVWDLKSPVGSSEKSTIAKQFKAAAAQAERMVLDLSRVQLPEDLATEQVHRRFFGQNKLREVLVIHKDGSLELLTHTE